MRFRMRHGAETIDTWDLAASPTGMGPSRRNVILGGINPKSGVRRTTSTCASLAETVALSTLVQ